MILTTSLSEGRPAPSLLQTAFEAPTLSPSRSVSSTGDSLDQNSQSTNFQSANFQPQESPAWTFLSGPTLLLLALTLILVFASPAFADEQPWANRDDVDSTFDNASSIESADIDGDGDLDMLAAAEAEGAGSGEVSWWENTAGDGSSWTKHIINGASVRQTRKAAAADFDGDGDLDVVAITEFFQDILVYLNSDGSGTAWSEVVVDDNVPFVCTAEAADIDGDGDIDIVGGGKRGSHELSWWENDGSAGTWTEHTIQTNFTGPCAVAMADIDKDGFIDVFAGAEFLDRVSWFKNPGAGGGSWTATQISSSLIDGVRAVDSGDYDGDGDIDVVAAARAISDVFWFENTSGDGATWTEHLVDDDSNEAWDVHSEDVDRDGDMDFLVAARLETPPNPQGAVVLWDNTNGDGSVWTRYDVDSAISTPQGVWAGDLDDDGDVDVLSAAASDRVSWFENESIGRNAAWPEERSVDADFNGARAVALADLDCDSDLDVVAAGGDGALIEWWSNADGEGSQWTFETQIASAFLGAHSVAIGDLNGDGDDDVVATAETGNEVSLFSNTAGDGSAWSETAIDVAFAGAAGVAVGDIDGDGDLDVAAAAAGDNQFSWWENTNGDATSFTELSISGAVAATHTGATAIFLADLDGDGDLDVIGGAATDDDVLFFENTAGDGSTWSAVTIDANFNGPSSLWAADLDQDGDLDVVAAAEDGDDIAWFENTAGDGSTWSMAQLISENVLDGPKSIGVADFDGDGDLDVAAIDSLSGGSVVWYANDGDGSTWSAGQSILATFGGGAALAVGDVDRNGIVDLVAAAEVDDDVSFLPNLGGQFGLATLDTSPANLGNNVTDDVLRITATHNGRAGEADIELTSFELLLEETDLDPLTTNEAKAVIENLFVYLDNGDNTWTGGDTLVTTVANASIATVAGVQSVAFADSDVNVQIQQGTPRTYFIVLQTTANYSTRGLTNLRVSHLTEASSTAEDRVNDTPLRLAWAANTLAGPFDVNPLATPSADLLIESITDDTDPASAGGTVTYTVTVRNDGAWKAENVDVTSVLPGDTTLNETVGCAEDPSGSPTCSLGDLGLLETASFQITVNVDVAASGTLTYQATVGSDTDEAAPGDESASEQTEIQGEADLTISVGAGPSTYVAGEVLSLPIEVHNLGPSDESSALVTDTFPAAFQGVTWTCQGLGGASCGNPSGSGNISETVNMPAGSYVIFTANGTVQVGTTGTLMNTATVSGNNDSNAANDSATVDVPEVAESVFRDGFESGDLSAWTLSVP